MNYFMYGGTEQLWGQGTNGVRSTRQSGLYVSNRFVVDAKRFATPDRGLVMERGRGGATTHKKKTPLTFINPGGPQTKIIPSSEGLGRWVCTKEALTCPVTPSHLPSGARSTCNRGTRQTKTNGERRGERGRGALTTTYTQQLSTNDVIDTHKMTGWDGATLCPGCAGNYDIEFPQRTLRPAI